MTKFLKHPDGLDAVINSKDPMNEDVDFSFNSKWDASTPINEVTEPPVLKFLPKFHLLLADAGERTSIACAAEFCADLMNKLKNQDSLKIQELYLIEWLQQKMENIAAGESPDSAFSWTITGKAGPKERFFKKLKNATIGLAIKNSKRENPDMSLDEIFASVAEKKHVSHATAKKCYQDYQKLEKRLSDKK